MNMACLCVHVHISRVCTRLAREMAGAACTPGNQSTHKYRHNHVTPNTDERDVTAQPQRNTDSNSNNNHNTQFRVCAPNGDARETTMKMIAFFRLPTVHLIDCGSTPPAAAAAAVPLHQLFGCEIIECEYLSLMFVVWKHVVQFMLIASERTPPKQTILITAHWSNPSSLGPGQLFSVCNCRRSVALVFSSKQTAHLI